MSQPPAQLDEALRQRVQTHLQAFPRQAARAAEGRAAAVALLLLPGDDGAPAFVLTRRSSRLRRHAGQFALPGGRLDPGEGPVEAALRELDEELGVDLPDERVLGLLDDFVTRSGFTITPVVLWAADVQRLEPDPGEVARAFRVPLADLYDPRVPVLWRIRGADTPCLSLPLLGTHIHSPTAALVYQLREVALEGRQTRVAHYEQPRFAWK